MAAESRDPCEAEHTLAGERGLPSVNTRGVRLGAGRKAGVVAMGLITLLALVAVNGGFSAGGNQGQNETRAAKSSEPIANHLPPLQPLPEPPTPKAEPSAPASTAQVIHTATLAPPAPPRLLASGGKDNELTPEARKRSAPLLAFTASPRAGASLGTPAQGQRVSASEEGRGSAGLFGGEAPAAGGLGARLKPTRLEGSRAGLLPERSLLITRGSFLPCALETALSSDVPGMTSCRLTRDVYGTDGKVLLLERGSRLTGQYQGALQRGTVRIFVLWTRLETPHGVIVDLDSPGTDALGRSGLDGHIDSHFWERFGGAILLSLVDDFGLYLANRSRKPDGDSITIANTSQTAQSAASIALENSINIPPTLVKNQGDHINIFVARDLDFRGVYGLEVIP